MAKAGEVDATEAHAAFHRILVEERAEAISSLNDGTLVVAARGEVAADLLEWWLEHSSRAESHYALECACEKCKAARGVTAPPGDA